MAKPKWQSWSYKSYNKLASDLAAGRVDMDQIRSQYTELRRIASRRVNAVQKSSLPWTKGEKPVFMKSGNIVTEGQLAHEYIDIVKFLTRKNTTVKGRERQFQNVQRSLKAQGFNITKRNFGKFTRFMQWFKASKYAAMYDSNQDIVNEVFNAGGRGGANNWSSLFQEFMESGEFD